MEMEMEMEMEDHGRLWKDPGYLPGLG